MNRFFSKKETRFIKIKSRKDVFTVVHQRCELFFQENNAKLLQKKIFSILLTMNTQTVSTSTPLFGLVADEEDFADEVGDGISTARGSGVPATCLEPGLDEEARGAGLGDLWGTGLLSGGELAVGDGGASPDGDGAGLRLAGDRERWWWGLGDTGRSQSGDGAGDVDPGVGGFPGDGDLGREP